MEGLAWLLIFIAIGIMGFIMVKKVDDYTEEIRNQKQDTLKSREDIIKIACENPMMLSCVSKAIEKKEKDFKKTSFYFYTGCEADLWRMLEHENVDMILLMEKPDIVNKEDYGEKESSFVPSSMPEPTTGLTVEPIENQQESMYVLWNENRITEGMQKLLSNI